MYFFFKVVDKDKGICQGSSELSYKHKIKKHNENSN
jgi:hypothetical protein